MVPPVLLQTAQTKSSITTIEVGITVMSCLLPANVFGFLRNVVVASQSGTSGQSHCDLHGKRKRGLLLR